jgi:dTDP-4-amino-4,6-dideoxygalactose transaminase
MTPESMLDAVDSLPPDRRSAVKAVFPVHLNGQLCDIDGIRGAASRRGWAVVEDACHALGGAYADGTPIGAAQNLATFSFHPVKAIASGEGGMITTGDHRLAERLARLRNHGMVRDPARFEDRDGGFAGELANPWYYEMPEVGFNYRLTDIQAALARSQLGKLARFVSRRAALVARYDRLLQPLAPAVRPIERTGVGTPAWHLYVVRIDFAALGISRGALMNALRRRGIGTQVHYIPLHRQPYYRRLHAQRPLRGAEAYYAKALSLPLFASMRDADVDTVVGALAEECRS